MKGKKILLCEDDRAIQSTLRILLEHEGAQMRVAGSIREAEQAMEGFKPDLLVLDVGLPDGDGMQYCARLSAAPATRGLPIFILTARGASEDIVRGLQAGAEDYLPKPFHEKEFLARVQVILRRRRALPPKKAKALALGSLRLDPAAHRAFSGKRTLNLTLREFEILEVLMTHSGQALSRADIIRQAWGEGHATVERAVDVHLGHLREKLGREAERITTVPGVGYRFEAD